MRINELREQFPALSLEIGGRPLVYFDNAATSQRPAAVADKVQQMSLYGNANIHRAVHTLSARATDAYEAARDRVVAFINAASRREVIFTAGATSALNLVAYSFSSAFIGEGDEIIVGIAEHHSNLVPWQMAALRHGAKVKYLPVTEAGRYDPAVLDGMITPSTRLVCLAHASNVLGVVNPVAELVGVCHSHGVPVLIDGAQGIVHSKVDVQALGCDFYVFSAHKVFGPTGVGVLYGRQSLLEQMPPFLCGGEMVGTVTVEGTTFAPLPAKFEAGTQNFNSVAALPEALDIADNILNDSELNEQMEAVKLYLYRQLKSIEGLHLYGDPGEEAIADKLPLFSFTIDGVHHEDMAILLDKMGVAVRSGQMCAEPLMTECSRSGMLRASLLPYNTMEEAEYFVKCLDRALNMLR